MARHRPVMLEPTPRASTEPPVHVRVGRGNGRPYDWQTDTERPKKAR